MLYDYEWKLGAEEYRPLRPDASSDQSEREQLHGSWLSVSVVPLSIPERGKLPSKPGTWTLLECHCPILEACVMLHSYFGSRLSGKFQTGISTRCVSDHRPARLFQTLRMTLGIWPRVRCLAETKCLSSDKSNASEDGQWVKWIVIVVTIP